MFCDFLNSTFIKTVSHFVLIFGFREKFDSICFIEWTLVMKYVLYHGMEAGM